MRYTARLDRSPSGPAYATGRVVVYLLAAALFMELILGAAPAHDARPSIRPGATASQLTANRR